ncbi:hypothetical protein [Candidatus Erwinia dacicola]|uniref:Uncharacterized protein n=1 Tax=Candidatus Erwinia dacicola TaxID=252393 RepID=A0A1E7Z464_9GAMM|nr:hypothetical protein [Candidatus Erwinia dacicola]OFC63577.1 hypothetical protein BBW68_04750 [Candidatus Erwinia dacicola]RAP69864.1 hypothetical protein ACZ87_03342 [Candidatus Erwinia dacicola]
MKSFDHLKHTGSEYLDPRLLIACITGHSYRDAMKILAGQGCHLAAKTVTVNTQTGFADQESATVELEAFREIREYLAFCGGAEAMPHTLERITQAVQELMKRT